MEEYPCKVCGGMLNLGMCQGGIKIDGVSHFTHVACADVWAASSIQVYKVTSPGNGSYIEVEFAGVEEAIQNLAFDESLTITPKKMTRAEVEQLEEFQGW